MEIVQIDHTLADIILVDQFERKPLGRPRLTLTIDVATRVVLDAYMSFDTPSILSIGLCLHHCARTKSIRAPEILEEFEDRLNLEISRYHNSRLGGLGRTPLAA